MSTGPEIATAISFREALYRIGFTLMLAACNGKTVVTPTVSPESTAQDTATMNIIPPTPTETFTPTETPTLTSTATPEQLGGSKMAYMRSNEGSQLDVLPESVISLLVSSNPDVWKQPTGYTYSDGTPVPWGTSFETQRSDGSHVVYVFAKVRGVVREPYPRSLGIAGTYILPVLEIPTFEGGSNFIVGYELDDSWSSASYIGESTLKNGIPLDWNSEHIFPAETLVRGTTFRGLLNGKEVGALLDSLIGKTILISYSVDDGRLAGQSMKQVAEGMPINNNGASVVDSYNPIVSVIEQK